MPWFRKHHTCPCGTDWWDVGLPLQRPVSHLFGAFLFGDQASTLVFNSARPASNAPPTIFSVLMKTLVSLPMNGCGPLIAQVTSAPSERGAIGSDISSVEPCGTRRFRPARFCSKELLCASPGRITRRAVLPLRRLVAGAERLGGRSVGREFSHEGMLDSFILRKNVTVNLNTPRLR